MQGDELKPISRTILMDELEPELLKSGIDGYSSNCTITKRNS
jgi:hypothetical protein